MLPIQQHTTNLYGVTEVLRATQRRLALDPNGASAIAQSTFSAAERTCAAALANYPRTTGTPLGGTEHTPEGLLNTAYGRTISAMDELLAEIQGVGSNSHTPNIFDSARQTPQTQEANSFFRPIGRNSH